MNKEELAYIQQDDVELAVEVKPEVVEKAIPFLKCLKYRHGHSSSVSSLLTVCGGYLPKYFVEKKGMEPYSGRMRAMLIFAFFPLLALFAQHMMALKFCTGL